MIEPDLYIDEYYAMNHSHITKQQQNKYSNLNFTRLTSDRKLVSIKVDMLLKNDLNIRDRFEWDLNDEKKSPEIFARNLVSGLEELIDADLIEYNYTSIKNQIYDQLLEHVEKNTFFPRLRLIKKENEAASNNQLCMNCNTIIYNQDYCLNCMYVFEKKQEKKIIPKENIPIDKNDDIFRQTERQRILELRQKNISYNDNTASYTQDGKEKKICKRCSEVNVAIATECRSCKSKFPLM